ncbi:hypothetical protein, partial [Accumulibacter sp.]|uniref:hypothetical protein n=1 Tax=Accumulibacter sp. TaxID=2053492 RepID=UPI00262A8C4D
AEEHPHPQAPAHRQRAPQGVARGLAARRDAALGLTLARRLDACGVDGEAFRPENVIEDPR